MGIPASRIEVLSNGVDPVDLPGVEHEDGRVLFVSRLEREKGVLDAISVLEGHTAADPRVRGSSSAEAVSKPMPDGRPRRAVDASSTSGALDHETLNREYARAAS